MIRVDSRHGPLYWFSDRRVLREQQDVPRFESVVAAHWMFQDLAATLRKAHLSGTTPEEIKAAYFDRLEIETANAVIVLEGLGPAYWPTLHFFWWISPACPGTQDKT